MTVATVDCGFINTGCSCLSASASFPTWEFEFSIVVRCCQAVYRCPLCYCRGSGISNPHCWHPPVYRGNLDILAPRNMEYLTPRRQLGYTKTADMDQPHHRWEFVLSTRGKYHPCTGLHPHPRKIPIFLHKIISDGPGISWCDGSLYTLPGRTPPLSFLKKLYPLCSQTGVGITPDGVFDLSLPPLPVF